MDDDFTEKIKSNSNAPWRNVFLKTNGNSPLSSKNKSEVLLTLTMKGVLLVEIARPDLEPGLGLLSYRVRASMQQDWSKLSKTISLALSEKDEVSKLSDGVSKNFQRSE